VKRHPVLIPLSRHHHDHLVLAQLLKHGSPPYRGLPDDLNGKIDYLANHFRESLLPHMILEEQVLYPFIKEKVFFLDELVEDLEREHQEMTFIFNEIIANRDWKDLDRLGTLLEIHIRKEERVLFQKLQDELQVQDWSVLEAKLKQSGKN